MEEGEYFYGLTEEQVALQRAKYGKNILTGSKKHGISEILLNSICEPAFLLLFAATALYFFLGKPADGAVMLAFVTGMAGIDFIQQFKTSKKIQTLKTLSSTKAEVIREGRKQEILCEDLVPQDIVRVFEGMTVPADGEILQENDFCTDESLLTGESVPIWKSVKDLCYAKTVILHGSAILRVLKTGKNTDYGKIYKSIEEAPAKKAPLQCQINKLIRICAWIAGGLFVLTTCITFIRFSGYSMAKRLTESILAGITLAMAMIPEEFPVIFTVFLSMGAWRSAKKHALVRNLPSVETLGKITVLCADKTGTLTEDFMEVYEIKPFHVSEEELLWIAGMGCEKRTYDPMEKAILSFCWKKGLTQETLFSGELQKEYPFTNKDKMMGHMWRREGKNIIAAKGSPENIFTICNLTEEESRAVEKELNDMARRGLRVIAVAGKEVGETEPVPDYLPECRLCFYGLLGFYNPPKLSVKRDIKELKDAGIRVIMVTGDNSMTAESIGRQIGITDVYSRVIPEQKMEIIRKLKEEGEITAMIGDGVNDAPALKYADIGIAMGKRGTQAAREAADLILLDDNFSTVVTSIHDGRRIYHNMRKAVGYVITIHIPIALSSLILPFTHIAPENFMLLPVHIVLLELMIDPTCSIVLERQLEESELMHSKPEKQGKSLIDFPLAVKSILQGSVLFAVSFGLYLAVLFYHPEQGALARTMGIVCILFANLFLIHVNGSESRRAVFVLGKLWKDRVMRWVHAITFIVIILILYTPLAAFLKLTPLTGIQLLEAFMAGLAGVYWYDLTKNK